MVRNLATDTTCQDTALRPSDLINIVSPSEKSGTGTDSQTNKTVTEPASA